MIKLCSAWWGNPVRYYSDWNRRVWVQAFCKIEKWKLEIQSFTVFPMSAIETIRLWKSNWADERHSVLSLISFNGNTKQLRRGRYWICFAKESQIKAILLWMLLKPSYGPGFCVIWLWETLASGWVPLWESSFIPWFVPYALRIRSGPELAGSEETRQVGIERLKRDSPSYWTPWTIFL